VSLPLIGADAVPWLSVEQMREVDRIMVGELGITLVRIMENGGRNLAELARHLCGGHTTGQAIVVLVGPGGNGGGGLVPARIGRCRQKDARDTPIRDLQRLSCELRSEALVLRSPVELPGRRRYPRNATDGPAF
jgi:NAD(P)H-hydrate epimerase